MHMLRKTVSIGLVFSVLLGVFAFSGCSKKDKGGVKKVSKDTPWFDSTTVEIGGQYKDMNLFFLQEEIIGAYKDGVLVRTIGSYKPFWEVSGTPEDSDANDFENIDYYGFDGELIKSVDISKTFTGYDNRSVEGINIFGDKIRIKIIEFGNGKNTYYWADLDLETGIIGEPEKIVIPSDDSVADRDILSGETWKIGDYYVTLSMFYNTFLISNNDKSRIVDLAVEMPFTEILYIANHINLSEKEIIFVCLSNDIRFLYLNVETGEVKNADEEYSWLKSINYSTQIACFDGKTYTTDQEGIKYINFETKELEEVLSFNSCNINKYTTAEMELLSVNEDKYVLSGTNEYSGAEITVLEKAKSDPHAGKIIITADTLGQTTIDYPVCEAIKVFNDTNDEYFIQFVNNYKIYDYIDYSGVQNEDERANIYYNAASVLSNQATSDMIAGDGPDIVLYAHRYGQFLSEEYLVDLNKYIDDQNGIDKSSYFSNVFEAAETDGKLFYMPVDFNINGIFTRKSNVRDGQTGFTYEEYIDFVDKVCNGQDPMNDTQLGVICTLYSYVRDDCFNGNEADFNNEAFRALCEYVKDNVTDNTGDVYGQTELSYYAGIRSTLSFHGDRLLSGTLLGLPSTDGRGPYMSIGTSVGISAFAPSVVADGAWEFVKTCLSDGIQEIVTVSYSNPVRISAYDSTAKAALEDYKKNDPSYSVLNPIDDSVIESYKEALLSASVIEVEDPAVFCVIREELPPYFLDQKSLDEVLVIINNRVSTIVAER